MAHSHPNLTLLADHAARHGVRSADPLRQPLDQARQSALDYQAIWNSPAVSGVHRQELFVPSSDGGHLRLWIIRPDGVADLAPVLVYFHGGGFAYNSLDTHERLMGLLARRAGVAVLGVGYSLAPETRFPGQLHQALAALRWLEDHGAQHGLDARNWAVGGDSAGANLALAATLARRDVRLSLPAVSVLLYGMFSADLDTPTHRAFGGGAYGLPTERVDWFWRQYVADFAQRDNPLAAPLRADLRGLPPQLLIGAGFDCLLDDSTRLARRLSLAGVVNHLTVYPDVPHSFMQASAILPAADQAVSEAAAVVRQYLFPSKVLAAE